MKINIISRRIFALALTTLTFMNTPKACEGHDYTYFPLGLSYFHEKWSDRELDFEDTYIPLDLSYLHGKWSNGELDCEDRFGGLKLTVRHFAKMIAAYPKEVEEACYLNEADPWLGEYYLIGCYFYSRTNTQIVNKKLFKPQIIDDRNICHGQFIGIMTNLGKKLYDDVCVNKLYEGQEKQPNFIYSNAQKQKSIGYSFKKPMLSMIPKKYTPYPTYPTNISGEEREESLS